MSEWKAVGNIGVDAGLCWVGDPCYTVAKDSSHVWPTWQKFCDDMDFDQNVNVYDAGIAVSSGYGDGEYTVYVKEVKGRIKELKVVFF